MSAGSSGVPDLGAVLGAGGLRWVMPNVDSVDAARMASTMSWRLAHDAARGITRPSPTVAATRRTPCWTHHREARPTAADVAVLRAAAGPAEPDTGRAMPGETVHRLADAEIAIRDVPGHGDDGKRLRVRATSAAGPRPIPAGAPGTAEVGNRPGVTGAVGTTLVVAGGQEGLDTLVECISILMDLDWRERAVAVTDYRVEETTWSFRPAQPGEWAAILHDHSSPPGRHAATFALLVDAFGPAVAAPEAELKGYRPTIVVRRPWPDDSAILRAAAHRAMRPRVARLEAVLATLGAGLAEDAGIPRSGGGTP